MARSTLQISLSIITKTDGVKTSVIFWAASNMMRPDDYKFDYSLDSLFSYIKKNHVTKIYIHDDDYVMSYIYDYLIKNNWVHDPLMNEEKRIFEPGSYDAFIINGKCMYLKIRYNYNYNSTCTFVSSKNILRNSISEINTSYECGVDINDCVDESIQLGINDELTTDMLNKTVYSSRIIANALHSVKSTFNLTELTVGSNAVKSWKKLDDKKYTYLEQLPLNIERDIYLSYRGGYNWINKKYKGVEIREGVVLDVNSLFPWIMKTYPMPIGIPVWHDKLVFVKNKDGNSELYKYSIIKLTIGGDDKHPGALLKAGCLPTVSNMCQESKTTSMIFNEYQEKLVATTVWMTGFDYELFQNNYDISDVHVEGCYVFKTKTGLFDNFIDHWYTIKREQHGAKRELSKLMLDNLHGKLGTKIEHYRGGNWIHQTKQKLTVVDGVVTLDKDTDTNNTSIRYMPISIFVNSIARMTMIYSCQFYYDRLIYIDTDGGHFKGLEPLDLIIDNQPVFKISPELGDFKVESIFKKAKYLGLKNYVHYNYTDFDKFDSTFKHGDATELDVKMAGASDEVRSKVTWDLFNYSQVIKKSKKVMKNIDGGKIRYYVDYTIREKNDKKETVH